MSGSISEECRERLDQALGIVGTVDIEGDGDLPRVCDALEDMLIKGKVPIYQRGGMLVRVVDEASRVEGIKRDLAAPRIVPFDDLSLADHITRFVAIRRRNRKTGELLRVDCPRAIAQTILARREWSFPVLEAVVEHPVMLPSGECLWESGYHAESGLLLQLPWPGFFPPEEDATEAMVHGALDEFLELLSGFDFVDDVDRSVAIAFLLTAFVRPALPTSPAFAIDAHAAGSGKSTLVRVQSNLATGREPAFLTFRDDPTELQKLLFAAMLEGDQHIAIDNVDTQLGGADLSVMITSPVYRGRVLGQSVNASVPTKAVLSFNGNNLQITGDLTRRVLVARLDPSCERPAEREFRFDPLSLVRDERAGFVCSALTILLAYHEAAAKGEGVKLRPFGSFEEWSRLVREPLVWCGLPDPVDSIRTLEAADPERAQLRAMLQAVVAIHAQQEFKAASLIQATKSKHQGTFDGGPALSDAQAAALTEALQAVCERNGELNAKALGRWFLKVHGRIDDGLRFETARQTNVGMLWRIRRAD
jgi:putative DNA primase/helicase